MVDCFAIADSPKAISAMVGLEGRMNERKYSYKQQQENIGAKRTINIRKGTVYSVGSFR